MQKGNDAMLKIYMLTERIPRGIGDTYNGTRLSYSYVVNEAQIELLGNATYITR
jgi:hypothetical protein